MKQGIHLGPARGRSRLLRTMVLIAAIGTAGHWALMLRARGALERDEAEAASAASTLDVAALSESQGQMLWELEAVASSGLLDSLSVTRVLHAVEEALPEGVALVSVSLNPTPPQPALVLEAFAQDQEAVRELEGAMVRSGGVLSTRLLEERPSRDGGLSVRLQVDLASAAAGDARSSRESAQRVVEAAP